MNTVSDRLRPSSNRRTLAFAAVLALVLALYPPVYALVVGGSDKAVGFFAADAFYYLSVAARSDFGSYTFDGEFLTNGFHPLWQFVLQLLVESGLNSPDAQITVAFWLSVLFASAGMILVSLSLVRFTRSAFSVLLLFPGPFYLLAAQVDTRYGTIWSFMNSMESPLSLLFFGGLVFYISTSRFDPARARIPQLVVVSLLCAGVMMSRLDDVFLVAAIGVWILWSNVAALDRKEALVRVSAFVAPVALILAAYLIYNLSTVGILMPISGTMKAGVTSVAQNIFWVGSILFPPANAALHSVAGLPSINGLYAGVAMRAMQMLLPMLGAAVFLRWPAVSGLQREGTESGLWPALFFYVLAKGGYNFFFVPLWDQGHWYFPLSIVILNFGLVVGLWSALRSCLEQSKERRWVSGMLLVLLTLFLVSGIATRMTGDNNAHYTTMMKRGPAIRAELAKRNPDFKIIEFDDGILNFSLGVPTLSGFGFTIDREGAKSLKDGKLLEMAADRGYNLLGSMNYSPAIEQGMTSSQLRKILSAMFYLNQEKDLDSFDFAVLFIDGETGATFISFAPKGRSQDELAKVPAPR